MRPASRTETATGLVVTGCGTTTVAPCLYTSTVAAAGPLLLRAIRASLRSLDGISHSPRGDPLSSLGSRRVGVAGHQRRDGERVTPGLSFAGQAAIRRGSREAAHG